MCTIHNYCFLSQESDSEGRIGVIPNPSNTDEHVIKLNKIVYEAFKQEDKLKILVKHLSQAMKANKDHIEIFNSIPVRFKFPFCNNLKLQVFKLFLGRITF